MEENNLKVITSKKEIQQLCLIFKQEGKSIGFVPTMGFLHEGHLSLVKEARKANDIVIMSIFVNPLQFGPGEDYDAYPRDRKRDEMLAEEAGVDFIFHPDVDEMYQGDMSIEMKVTKRTDVLCGKNRPGHFDGVITVVTKLFHIISPDRAYFGLKDAQQFAVISGLVDDLDFPIELVPVNTIREEDGLAISSRNVYLTDKERKQAPYLYQSLLLAKETIMQGEKDIRSIMETIQKEMKAKMDIAIDYVEVLSYPELEPLRELKGKIIIASAVKFSKARLIDNIIFEIA